MTDADELVQITCEGCQRSFSTIDGLGMLCAIKRPCTDCGGRFVLDKVLQAAPKRPRERAASGWLIR